MGNDRQSSYGSKNPIGKQEHDLSACIPNAKTPIPALELGTPHGRVPTDQRERENTLMKEPMGTIITQDLALSARAVQSRTLDISFCDANFIQAPGRCFSTSPALALLSPQSKRRLSLNAVCVGGGRGLCFHCQRQTLLLRECAQQKHFGKRKYKLTSVTNPSSLRA